MRYQNGQLYLDSGLVVPLNDAAAAQLRAIDPNFGRYEYIDLTTGEAKLSGVVDGQIATPAVASSFIGRDAAIAALPETLADESNAAVLSAMDQGKSYRETVVEVMSGGVDASAGITKTLSDGSHLFIQAPIPEMQNPGDSVSITVPSITSLISVEGVVELAAGAHVGIGSTSGMSQSVHWSLVGATLNITSDGAASAVGGYVAVHYIP